MTDATRGEARPNAVQIFHININCTDFDRSLGFYKLIGFRELTDLAAPRDGKAPPSFGSLGLGPILGLPDDCDGRAMLLILGDSTWATRIDLIEWRHPRRTARVKRTMSDPGVGRICLKVRDAAALHRDLVAAGFRPFTEPRVSELGGTPFWVFCCEDPDGTVMEFMQFIR